ncbi:MAG TPA: polysaccharide biosynthesis tyrosine autokinase, partial [Flavisolibacter sp.]|nr:polysaccharide biosynthesis tyrosine autokinase [Flavisolibacter sp.]
LDSIERKLQEYKSSRGAYDISSQSKLFLDNVSNNDNKLSDINIQLSVLNQVENYVTSKSSSGAIVPSTLGISDPLLSQLLDKLYDLELQHEKLKRTTAENNPLLVSVTDQITKIKPSILENIRSQRKSLEASKVNLSATNGSYSSILQTIPQKEKDLVNISREQSIKSGIYTFLLQKREEAALSYSSTVANNRVIDKAESSGNPVSPNKRNIYLAFVVAGMALGIGSITLKEALNNKILYREELEQLTTYPIIGEINFQKKKIDLVMEDDRSLIVAEQFRKLRATLGFMKINSSIKHILVTSSIPQEGKSFTTANLGLTLAMAGKKVILIEFDLINPSLSRKFEINSSKGVTDFLTGECEPEEIIKRTVANENLFVIPSGSLPHNPSELILNGKVEGLLNYLDHVFDYVIIDSTPVCALSDAYVFSPMCDITLYMVRHGITPKILIRRLERNDMTKNLKNVGIVFNGIKSRGFFKKDNNEYGYGYNYIYNRKSKKSFNRKVTV